MKLDFFDASLLVAKYEKWKDVKSEYLLQKYQEGDWKSVSAVAIELAEIDACIKVWSKFINENSLLK